MWPIQLFHNHRNDNTCTFVCRLFDNDAPEGVKQCMGLLQEHDLNTSVRYGDVYALLIEYFASQQNYERVSSSVAAGVLLKLVLYLKFSLSLFRHLI